jgi:hypothetical protein
VNITNDEWFGNGAALQQHAAMAPFRAVEHHVPLLRCANTGLTEVIDAHGVVTAKLPVFTPRVLVAPLPAAGSPTLFTLAGDWPGLLAALIALVLALAPWRAAARVDGPQGASIDSPFTANPFEGGTVGTVDVPPRRPALVSPEPHGMRLNSGSRTAPRARPGA